MSKRFKGHPELNFSPEQGLEKDESKKTPDSQENGSIEKEGNSKEKKKSPKEVLEFLQGGYECPECGVPIGMGNCHRCINYIRSNGIEYPLPQIQSTVEMKKRTAYDVRRSKIKLVESQKPESIDDDTWERMKKLGKKIAEDEKKNINRSE